MPPIWRPSDQVLIAGDCTITATPGSDPLLALSFSTSGNHDDRGPFGLRLQATDPEGAAPSYPFDCDGNGKFEVGRQSDPTGTCVLLQAGAFKTWTSVFLLSPPLGRIANTS